MTDRYRLTPLEIAGGLPLGMEADAPALPDVSRGLTPLAAFEDSVRAALDRPPCLVTFSGGRDSSAVLAVAVRLAREEGHAPPIPITLRFVDAPGTDEVAWQHRVVEHLGVQDWLRLDVGDEVDYVGPVARRLLLRHGVVHPGANLLFWIQLEHARGGSLLTGYGGDPVAGGWLPPHAAEVRAGLTGPRPGDLPALVYPFTPASVRRGVVRRRLTRQAWLRPGAYAQFAAARADELASRPVRWDRFLEWEPRLRRGCALEWAVGELGKDADALVVHPFHDRRFMSALAREGGRRGLGDRTSVMRRLFADDLPDDVLARSSKANFALTYFRGHARAFARRWDGGGLDPELVDAEALRRVWLNRIVDMRSALAIQAAWLDSAQRGLEELPAGGVEHADVARANDAPGG